MAEDGPGSPKSSPLQAPHLPVHPALPSQKGFLALSEDVSLSTRGQRLPSLIQNRLSAAKDVPRRSSARPTDQAHGESSTDLERGLGRQREYEAGARQQDRVASISGDGRGVDIDYGFDDVPEPPPSFPLARPRSINGDRPERKASVLLTPQMRSQRLIGKSNPRYKW